MFSDVFIRISHLLLPSVPLAASTCQFAESDPLAEVGNRELPPPHPPCVHTRGKSNGLEFISGASFPFRCACADLTCVCVQDPEVGYVQGMNFLVGFLMHYIEDESEARA